MKLNFCHYVLAHLWMETSYFVDECAPTVLFVIKQRWSTQSKTIQLQVSLESFFWPFYIGFYYLLHQIHFSLSAI